MGPREVVLKSFAQDTAVTEPVLPTDAEECAKVLPLSAVEVERARSRRSVTGRQQLIARHLCSLLSAL